MRGETPAEKVAFLRQASAYPDASLVEVVETHMSWVFLTDRHAYKLKKPVRYEYLDFSTLDARRRDGEEEVRLNRRLAPEVYLGVVPLVSEAQGLRLGGTGHVVDWLVVMRRLPRNRMLDELLARSAATEADVRAVARRLTVFYATAERVPVDPRRYREQLLAEVVSTVRALLDQGMDGEARAILEAQLSFLHRSAALVEQRAREGRIVEGHGDLRPEHICLTAPPQIIDCLEFNRRFRVLDAADEFGFLAMECERLDAPWVGPLLFQLYEAGSGDHPPEALVHFYESYRACLRAKLALWHLRERNVRTPEKWPRRAREYLALASSHASRIAQADSASPGMHGA